MTLPGGAAGGVSPPIRPGYQPAMAGSDLRSIPLPGELWLSCPPYLMVARVVALDAERELVSYELHDADGEVLESVAEAPLGSEWWRTFQPLQRRFG